MKNYLLFDLDGTLTDPKMGICTCVQYALKEEFGIEEPDLDKLEPFIGPPLKESFMQFYHLTEEQGDAALAKYRERFSTVGLYENQMYPGVANMLQDLKKRGLTLAIASSKPTVFVEKILQHFNIYQYFDVIVGSELNGTRVNKEEVVLEALRRLFGDKPVDKEKVYMIGDRKFDVEGAHFFGLECVAVSYGYGDMEELKAAKADYIVRSVEELHEFLLRGLEEFKNPKRGQILFALAYPFILFVLGQMLASTVLSAIVNFINDALPQDKKLLLMNEAGKLEYTNPNIPVVMEFVGFIVGAFLIRKIAFSMIRKARKSCFLSHLWPTPKKHYLFAVMATLGSVVGLNLGISLLDIAARSQGYRLVEEAQMAVWLPLGIIGYGLITPFAEEILFRGIIYNGVKKYFKPMPALFMSAAIFGMYHGNTVQGIYAFIMAFLMIYLYEYFGDFKAPLFVHIFSNLFAYVLMFISQIAPWFVNQYICLAFLLLAVAGVYLLNKDRKVF